MSRRRKSTTTGAMLELWRPPRTAGEAVGCLATTYTFDPGLFDEQCLARFLEVESEPNREELAFLLERESRLGAAYAGVIVDHTQAGVNHSLRWDVLPARIPAAKQHAKISLLAWADHVRIIVASANLTEAGYRSNLEVASVLDSNRDGVQRDEVDSAITFLRRLLSFVPAAAPQSPAVGRAGQFLDAVERQVADWRTARPSKDFRQHLVFTMPARDASAASGEAGFAAQSSLDDAIAHCRRHGGSPVEAWIASPFYDFESDTDAATAALCKSLARGAARRVYFCVPCLGEPDEVPVRLAAPASLRSTARQYSADVHVETLPQQDEAGNTRPWHAKMLALRSENYTSLLAGSSNFTRAGLGVSTSRNAEANVLTIALNKSYARLPGELDSVWPEMQLIEDPAAAQWQGPQPDLEEEQRAESAQLPFGFLSAVYTAGNDRWITLWFDAARLPANWSVHAHGLTSVPLLTDEQWEADGRSEMVRIPWTPTEPPHTLVVRWPDGQAHWPLNVDDARLLPPPADVAEMSADEMLRILAAADPSAACRAWRRKQSGDVEATGEQDEAAAPVDLDPLHRYQLQATFLHRVRGRARVLAQLRKKLQRPAGSVQALQWQLEGFIGIRPLAERLLREVDAADGHGKEAILALADFLIVLDQVEYVPAEGFLPAEQSNRIYREFLRGLAADLNRRVEERHDRIGGDLMPFWNRVVERCRK